MFDFESLSLAKPEPVQGGAFFSQLTWNNGAPLYVQLTQCSTKDGVVTPKRNHYVDLMYEKPFPEETMEWVEKLEETVCRIIYSKRITCSHTNGLFVLCYNFLPNRLNPSRNLKSV